MFKNHPHKAEIKFIILPLVKESLNLCNDMMAGDFKERIYKRFQDPSNCEGLKFDFSYTLGSYSCPTLMQFSQISKIDLLQFTFSHFCKDKDDKLQ